MARKYMHVQIYEGTILKMKEEGKTRQEMADMLGLEKTQIKEFIKRYNRRQRIGMIEPKRKGRPRKHPPTTLEGMTILITELEREVDLLRSFLHAAGRM